MVHTLPDTQFAVAEGGQPRIEAVPVAPMSIDEGESMLFQNRVDAGRRLGEKLIAYQDRSAGLVLGLPRGGVPVAFEVARSLHLPLDIFLVRKLGVPSQPELAMGAIATGNVIIRNERVIASCDISEATFQAVADREAQELNRRERLYRGKRHALEVSGRIILLVDDGLATGSTMRAAVAALRHQNPARIIVAVPVAAPSVCAEFEKLADEVVCLHTPQRLTAVGQWYDDFSQTTDQQVLDLLESAAANRAHVPI